MVMSERLKATLEQVSVLRQADGVSHSSEPCARPRKRIYKAASECVCAENLGGTASGHAHCTQAAQLRSRSNFKTVARKRCPCSLVLGVNDHQHAPELRARRRSGPPWLLRSACTVCSCPWGPELWWTARMPSATDFTTCSLYTE